MAFIQLTDAHSRPTMSNTNSITHLYEWEDKHGTWVRVHFSDGKETLVEMSMKDFNKLLGEK